MTIAVDTMRPDQPMQVPGYLPPSCPNFHSVKEAPGKLLKAYLHPMSQNAANDQRFDCLACGYQTIFRHATQKFEQPPWWSAPWAPPVDENGRPIGVVMEAATAPVVTLQTDEGLARRIKDSAYPPAEPIVKRPVLDEADTAATAVTETAPDGRIGVSKSGASDDSLLSIKDAAEILGIKPTELLAKVRAGEVETTVVNGVRFVPARVVGG